jgi:hypothetical protein
MQNIPLVYCAGPFSAPTRDGVETNIRRMSELGVEVAKLGAYPWIPHANTALPEFEHVQPDQFWIAATLEQLRRCDAVLMSEDWKQSSGARGEHADAFARGQPIFYSLDELKQWLARRSLPDVCAIAPGWNEPGPEDFAGSDYPEPFPLPAEPLPRSGALAAPERVHEPEPDPETDYHTARAAYSEGYFDPAGEA